MSNKYLHAFYFLKPIFPRALQLYFRQIRANKILDSLKEPYIPSFVSGERLIPPVGYNCVVLLTHDVESIEGYKKIEQLRAIERIYSVPSCWNFVLEKYPIGISLLDNLVAEGCECGAHGLFHDGKLFKSREIFNQRMSRIYELACNYNMIGFRSPSLHRNQGWMSEMKFQWDSSFPAWDPFQPQPGGCGKYTPFRLSPTSWELPVTLTQDFTLFYELKQNSIKIWEKQFDYLADNGGLINIIIHPDYINKKLLLYYSEFIQYCFNQRTPWFTTPSILCKYLDGIK